MAGDNDLSLADNDLPPAVIRDLTEMQVIGSDSHIQVIVQVDTVQSLGNGQVLRLSIEQGRTTTIENLGERNMADPQILTDFIVWAADRYPSQRRALILWDHGNGYQKPNVGAVREPPLHAYGILQDDTDGTACCLSNAVVRQAIENAGIHFDLLGFDASQMGQIETAYEFRNAADLLVFSQETGQSNGWDYTEILRELRNHPGMTPEALAGLIVQTYRDFYEGVFYPANPGFEQYLNISAVRLGADMEELTSRVDDLAIKLTAAIQNPTTRDATVSAVGSATAAAQGMDLLTSPYVYLDLFDLAEKLSEQPGLDPSTRTTLANLKSVKNTIVISEYHGQARPAATGLSIVFFKLPEAADYVVNGETVYDPDYVSGARNLDFINDTAWNEFLTDYYTAAGLL
jgi:hypothetical protein